MSLLLSLKITQFEAVITGERAKKRLSIVFCEASIKNKESARQVAKRTTIFLIWARVLKTVWGQPHGGSNPSASAKTKAASIADVAFVVSENHTIRSGHNGGASKKTIEYRFLRSEYQK